MRGGFFNSRGQPSAFPQASGPSGRSYLPPPPPPLTPEDLLDMMPDNVKAELMQAAMLAAENAARPAPHTEKPEVIAPANMGPGICFRPGPEVPNLKWSPIELKMSLTRLDMMNQAEVKKKAEEGLPPEWYGLVDLVQDKARHLQAVVERMGKSDHLTPQDSDELRKALKDLEHGLIQAKVGSYNGEDTVVGRKNPARFLMAHVAYHVPQKLRDLGLTKTLVTAAEKRLTGDDHSASSSLMHIVSHVVEPYQLLLQGFRGLDGNKMEVRPKDLVLCVATNEHLLALAFRLWEREGRSPKRMSAHAGDNRPGSYAFLEALATCDEVLIPAQIQLCKSLLSPTVREAVGPCLRSQDLQVVGVTLYVMRRAVGFPTRVADYDLQGSVKSASLYAKWPRVMPAFVSEEWTRSLIPCMEFLSRQMSKSNVAFMVGMDVLRVFNAATNNHPGAFQKDSHSQTPHDTEPWPPALIRAHSTLVFQAVVKSPPLFQHIVPCIRPYAHSPSAFDTKPLTLPGVGVSKALDGLHPQQLLHKEFNDALQVFLTAFKSARKEHMSIVASHLNSVLVDDPSKPPAVLYRASRLILFWAEALCHGRSAADLEKGFRDRNKQWESQAHGKLTTNSSILIEIYNNIVKDCWQASKKEHFDKETVLQGLAQLVGLLVYVSPFADTELWMLFIRIIESREMSCQWLRSQPILKPLIELGQQAVGAAKAMCLAEGATLPAYLIEPAHTDGEKCSQPRPTSSQSQKPPQPRPGTDPSPQGTSSERGKSTSNGISASQSTSTGGGSKTEERGKSTSNGTSASQSTSTSGGGKKEDEGGDSAGVARPEAQNTGKNTQDAKTASTPSKLRRCLGCQKEGHGFKTCAVCKGHFCSRECQCAVWPQHKLVCRPPA